MFIFSRRSRDSLTDALAILLAAVAALAIDEVVAARGRDSVVVDGGVGDEVSEADALSSTVVDLHVLHDAAVHRRHVAVAVLLRQGAMGADACGPSAL